MSRSKRQGEGQLRAASPSRKERESPTGIVVIGDGGLSLISSIREVLRQSAGHQEVFVSRQPKQALDALELTGYSGPRMADMIESMMPSRVPTAPMVLQARRNTEARTSLIDEFGLLTSAEIAELNRSKAENRAALASRWKGEGKIFSVKHDGRDWFPGFQFYPDGVPREVIAAALEALDGARGWETALWFTASNGYLEGRRPVDLLEEDAEAVVEAAGHEAEEVYF